MMSKQGRRYTAKFKLKKLGQKVEGIIIHHDQDGVYIGYRWLYQVAVEDKDGFGSITECL